jgi:hypothetical protein
MCFRVPLAEPLLRRLGKRSDVETESSGTAFESKELRKSENYFTGILKSLITRCAGGGLLFKLTGRDMRKRRITKHANPIVPLVRST